MKKIGIAALLFCGALTSFAQSTKNIRFGLTGGFNVADVTDLEANSKLGFNVGGRMEYSITNHFYLGTGLMLTQKGYQIDLLDISDSGRGLYLEIPLQVGLHHYFENNAGIFGETGPYMAFGVGGRTKHVYEASDRDIVTKGDYFGSQAARTFDMGWSLRAGVEVNQFQVHLSYEYGLTKVFDNQSAHNSNFSVGLSYFF